MASGFVPVGTRIAALKAATTPKAKLQALFPNVFSRMPTASDVEPAFKPRQVFTGGTSPDFQNRGSSRARAFQ